MNAGLDGTYRDSCVVCMRGTDTGLAFIGEAEWAVAGLTLLGVPENLALSILSAATGCDPGMVPEGEITIEVRVCKGHADAVGLPVGLVAGGVPGVRPKGGGS